MAEFLTSELARSGNYRVIEKAQINRVLGNLAKEQSDLYDQSNAAQFGKLLSANLVLVTLAAKTSSGVDATSRLVEVETGQVLGSVSIHETANNYPKLAEEIIVGLIQPKYLCSSQGPEHGPGQAFDNNEASFWEAAPGNFRGWIEINYPSKMRFSHAEFNSPETDYGSGVPKHFLLKFFDGSQWQTATKVSGNMRRTWAGDFSPQVASKWRIEVTDTIKQDTPVRISEFTLELKEETKDEIK